MDFNYFGESYLKFEKAFNGYYIGIEPLTFIIDDLLKAMSVEKTYFQLPANQCRECKRKWFSFEVVGDVYMFRGVFDDK